MFASRLELISWFSLIYEDLLKLYRNSELICLHNSLFSVEKDASEPVKRGKRFTLKPVIKLKGIEKHSFVKDDTSSLTSL